MKRIPSFDEFINETIRSEEAHRDPDAIQTVVDGKRDLGYITLRGSIMQSQDFWKAIEEGGLKVLRVPSNPNECYVYYRPGAEAQAEELRDIAEKYDGYLAYYATEEDSRRIGELLGYDKIDIDWYIKKNYK